MWCSSVVLRVALVCAVGAGRGAPPPPRAPPPAGALHDVLCQIFTSLKVEPEINKLIKEYASRARAGRAPHQNDKWKKVLKFTRLDIETRNTTTYYTTIINEILNERGKYPGLNYSLFDSNIKNIFDTAAEIKNIYFQNDSRSITDSEERQSLREADSIQSNAADAEVSTTDNSADESDAWVSVVPYVSVKQTLRAANDSRRIFGGAPTRVSHFPFAASVHALGRLACAGAIIAADLVISAASCLHFVPLGGPVRRARGAGRPGALAVRVGSSYFDSGGDLIPVLQVYRHPAFDPDSLAHNLAIMRLRRPIVFQKWDSKIKKINIDKNGRGRFFNSDSVTIVGWGAKTVSNKVRRQKMSMAVLDIYSTADCQDIYSKTYVTKKHFCAGLEDSGAGACNSDVGAPGVVRGLLAGVVSFGSPICGARDSPTVFTKLGYYSDWIGKIIKNVELQLQLYMGRPAKAQQHWRATYYPLNRKLQKHYTKTTTGLHNTVYTFKNASQFKVDKHIQPIQQVDEFQNYLREIYTFSTTATGSNKQSRFNVEPMQDTMPNYVESSEELFMSSQHRNTFRKPTPSPYLGHTTMGMDSGRNEIKFSEQQSALWQYPYAFQALRDTNLRQNKNQFSREPLFRPLYGTEFKKSTQPLYTYQTVMSMNGALDPYKYNTVQLGEEQRIQPLREAESWMATRSPYMFNPYMSADLQHDPIQQYAVKSTDNNFNLPYKNLPEKSTRRPFMFHTGMNTNLGLNQILFGDKQLVRPLYNTRFGKPTRQPYNYPTVALSIDYKIERLERNAVNPKPHFIRSRNVNKLEKSFYLLTTHNDKNEAFTNTTSERNKYFQKNKHFNVEKNALSKTYTNSKHTQLKWLPEIDEDTVAGNVNLPARRPQTVQPNGPYSKRKDLAIEALKKKLNQGEQAPKISSDQEINKKIDRLLEHFEEDFFTSVEMENLQNRNVIQNAMSKELRLSEGENQSEKQEEYSVKYQNLNRQGMSVERYKNSEDIFNTNKLPKDLFKGIPKNDVYKILAEGFQTAED